MRTSAVLIATAMVCVVASGCSTSPAATPQSCRGADIGARFSGWNGATGSLVGGVAFVDKASVSCVMQGNPDVHLVDASGQDLPVKLGKYSVESALPITLLPGVADAQPHHSLNPGQATFSFIWSNWCQTGHSPTSLRVDFNEGQFVSMPITTDGVGGPRCDAPSGASYLSVGPIRGVPSSQ